MACWSCATSSPRRGAIRYSSRLTGGSWGFQAGAQSSDIILVFTTRAGIEGIAGGKITLGADASVATGPVGRQGSAATDIDFNSEIYSYARTRGLFGGIALDGSVIRIDRPSNASFYRHAGHSRLRDLVRLRRRRRRRPRNDFSSSWPGHAHRGARLTRAAGRCTGSGVAERPAAAMPAAAEPARTYPLEDQQK